MDDKPTLAVYRLPATPDPALALISDPEHSVLKSNNYSETESDPQNKGWKAYSRFQPR